MRKFRTAKMVRVAFFTKLWSKINFWDSKLHFQSHPELQNIKNQAVNNTTTSTRSPKLTAWCPILVFFCPRTEHLRLLIDRSRPQLFISFFWLHCGSYSAPNDHFSFSFLFIFGIKSSPILTRLGKGYWVLATFDRRDLLWSRCFLSRSHGIVHMLSYWQVPWSMRERWHSGIVRSLLPSAKINSD